MFSEQKLEATISCCFIHICQMPEEIKKQKRNNHKGIRDLFSLLTQGNRPQTKPKTQEE